jgi:hypothetical protein
VTHYFVFFCFFKCRNSTNNWATFFRSKIHVLISQKVDWATFWATFSQTHLVTLIGSVTPTSGRDGSIFSVPP